MLGIFLDIETTGLDPMKHRVLELAFQVFDLKQGVQCAYFQALVFQPTEIWQLADPVSLEVNGFTEKDVQRGKSESEIAAEIISLFQGLGICRGKALFICQNPAFDRVFFSQLVDIYTQEKLLWPYHWLDFASMYWAHKMQRIREGKDRWSEGIILSKDAIAEEYGLPKEEKPHRAMNGVEHLLLCYRRLIGLGLTPLHGSTCA